MPSSKAHLRAVQKYETKSYDKILVRIRKENDSTGLTRDIITKAAEAEGMSLNAYILQAVVEKMNK